SYKMRTVILVGLILHLVITVVKINGDVSNFFKFYFCFYAFGDIISFPRTFAKIKKSYKHFAVYVGPKTNLFGQGDKDLFHRIHGKYCVFGSLKNEAQHQKENYLDGKLNKSSDADIMKNIKVMMEYCGKYKLFRNNCEHLATYVRYGRAYSKQVSNKALTKIEAEDPEFQGILNKLETNSETEAQDWDQDQAAAAG
uniref:LRAT domain-containing protein n=1 Tax=Amphilophus citrinellus TaxID=61819 RepID=A0A3Q0QRS1_AMPCI